MNHRFFGLGLALLCSIPATSQAIPSKYESRFAELETQLSQTSSDYAAHSANRREMSLDQRLQDGIVLQAAGDHQRAAYIFMDIVNHESWRGLPGYQTAQLELARALYEEGYYRLSQRHLIDLLKTGSGTERTDGVSLLLQVAQRTGDWEEVNAALADVTDFANSPAYLYIMGRAMFLQNDLETARVSLNSVNNHDEWGVKADYLLGVIEVEDRNLDAAIAQFDKVLSSDVTFRHSDKVRELAILAKARIYYEQTQWSKAIQYYQQIDESSEFFPTVLYEMAWTNIRMEEYVNAQQSFEILLLSYPNDKHAFETRKLLADIKRELGKYDDAMTSYQQLVDEFEPLMAKMENEKTNLIGRKSDLKRTIEEERYNDVDIVPERAKGLVAVGSDVAKFDTMLSDLSVTDANNNESEILIAEINAILSVDTNLENLPEFQQYTQTVREILINSLLLGYDFTANEEEFPEDVESLATEIAKLPRSKRERDILALMQSSAREERQARLHTLKLRADSLQHRARILKSWLDSGQAATMTDDERQQMVQKLNLLESQIHELRRHQIQIETKLAEVRSRNGESAESIEAMQRNLEQLHGILEERWSRDLSNGDASGDYRDMIERNRAILSDVAYLKSQIDTGLHERANEFRSRLNRESEFVLSERQRFTGAKSDVGDTAGEISARYWQSVFDQIRDMVLNADLGIVDLAWLQKDARSKELSETLEERKKEREILEQDFKQFLKESGQQ